MGRSVGFLRAVNVGKRRVPMASLKAAVEDLGFDDVWTYINSGNVVFSSSAARAVIEPRLEERFEAEYGFTVELPNQSVVFGRLAGRAAQPTARVHGARWVSAGWRVSR